MLETSNIGHELTMTSISLYIDQLFPQVGVIVAV